MSLSLERVSYPKATRLAGKPHHWGHADSAKAALFRHVEGKLASKAELSAHRLKIRQSGERQRQLASVASARTSPTKTPSPKSTGKDRFGGRPYVMGWGTLESKQETIQVEEDIPIEPQRSTGEVHPPPRHDRPYDVAVVEGAVDGWEDDRLPLPPPPCLLEDTKSKEMSKSVLRMHDLLWGDEIEGEIEEKPEEEATVERRSPASSRRTAAAVVAAAVKMRRMANKAKANRTA